MRKKAITHRDKRRTALAFDLGGTKIAAGIIDERGKILKEIRVPARFPEGKKAVLSQIGELGHSLLSLFPKTNAVGLASAGPLDPRTGVLLDPTNYASQEGTWGKTPLASLLKKTFKKPVFLENDAAAAMLAEHWIGRAKNCDNAMILTLGTGLGTGIVTNGSLVRSGRFLHTEAGHVILRAGDLSAPCGCGNFGCAEAYLSGRNFSRRARTRFADPTLDATEIAKRARANDPRAVGAFEEYAENMATAIHNYVVIFSPSKIILTGSFAEAADLFVPQTERRLEGLLKRRRIGVDLLPKIEISALHNRAGLIGAAYVALNAPSRI